MSNKKLAFRCQRCGLGLYPHESLLDLKPAQLQLLVNTANDAKDTIPSEYPDRQEGLQPIRNLPSINVPWGLSQLPETQKSTLLGKHGLMGSFVVLSDSMITPGPPSTSTSTATLTSSTSTKKKDQNLEFFARVNTLEKMFEIISSQTEIDFPVCTDCESLLIEGFKQKFDESCQERDSYIDFLNTLKAESEPSEKETSQLTIDIKNLELENEECLESLKDAESERRKLEQELGDLEKEMRDLEQEEQEFFKSRNEFDLEVMELTNEKDRVESLYERESNHLQKLAKVNVYNDVFCIGYDGYFGTINGLRLGRLKDRKVCIFFMENLIRG